MDNQKIILVEDEDFVRELYERVLQQAGFIVQSAVDGEAGLNLILQQANSAQKPALILLDIMMPKLNGIDVLNKIKQDQSAKEIPVLLLTNLGQENVIKEAFRLGAKGYLMKIRLTPYEVVSHIKDFLNNPTILNPEQIEL